MFNVTLTSDKSVTLAGYVLELYDGEIPKEGDFISDKKLWFKIVGKTRKRIDKIKVSKFNPSLWPENIDENNENSEVEENSDIEHS